MDYIDLDRQEHPQQQQQQQHPSTTHQLTSCTISHQQLQHPQGHATHYPHHYHAQMHHQLPSPYPVRVSLVSPTGAPCPEGGTGRGPMAPLAHQSERQAGGQDLDNILTTVMQVTGLQAASSHSSVQHHQQRTVTSHQRESTLVSARQPPPIPQVTTSVPQVTAPVPQVSSDVPPASTRESPQRMPSDPSNRVTGDGHRHGQTPPVQASETEDAEPSVPSQQKEMQVSEPSNVEMDNSTPETSELSVPEKQQTVRQPLSEKQPSVPSKGKQQEVLDVDPNRPPTLPGGLKYIQSLDAKKTVRGVWANRVIEKGERFGPFNGSLVDEATGCVNGSTWELCIRGKVWFYIDGKHRRFNNWLFHVRTARDVDDQNLEAIQYYGDIYFQAVKTINPGTELTVFYSEEYGRSVGFKTLLNDLKYDKEAESFQCTACQCHYNTAKSMVRHMKFAHDKQVHSLKESHSVRIFINTAIKKKVTEQEHEKSGSVAYASSTKKANSTAVVQRFICVTCGKQFPTKGRLNAHEKFHEFTALEHSCEVCGTECSSSLMLAKHMASHRAPTYKCDECGKMYCMKSNLTRHKRISHNSGASRGTFSCKVCSKVFDHRGLLMRHERLHSFTGALPISKRKENMRSEEKASGVGAAGEASTPPLPDLPKDFLGKRQNYDDLPRPFKCRFCKKRFPRRHHASHHEREVHTGRAKHKCDTCSKTYMSQNKLLLHMRKHTNDRPFKCMLCPRSFASESALNNHQAEHTGAKPFKCEFCGKGFKTRKYLTTHKRRVHQEREMKWKCSFCDKKFADKVGVVRHERRHKGIRPHVCLTCGKAFTSKHCLEAHCRIHTGEKPFECPHCGKRFSLNHHLTEHMLSHLKQQQKAQAALLA